MGRESERGDLSDLICEVLRPAERAGCCGGAPDEVRDASDHEEGSDRHLGGADMGTISRHLYSHGESRDGHLVT